MLLHAVLRPVVRFCLKRGLRVRELDEAVRRILVEEAKAAIERASGEVSVSKISVTTGVHRVEVSRLLAGESKPDEKHDVLNRVIGTWSQSRAFKRKGGDPKPLTFQGLSSEFATLVATVSKEVSHYPILFELERIGAIEYKDEKVELVVKEYTPEGDVEHGLFLLGEDVEDLLLTVEKNLSSGGEPPELHLRTTYDNVDPDRLTEIRRWILNRGAAFHKEMREYLSRFDRDINPNSKSSKEKGRVTVSAYSVAHEIEDVKELKPKKRGRKPCAPKLKK